MGATADFMWVTVDWDVEDVGFGEFRYKFYPDGRVVCDNECMDKNFVYNVWLALVNPGKLELVDNE